MPPRPRYTGWNEEETRHRNSSKDVGLFNQSGQDSFCFPRSYQLPTFTPVNRNPTKPHNPNPTFKCPTRGKDSNTIYDIPDDDDPPPASAVPQKRKRCSTAPARSKGAPATRKQARHQEEDSPISKRFASISSLDSDRSTQVPPSPVPKKHATRRAKSVLSKQTKAFPNTSIIKPNIHQSYEDPATLKLAPDYTINVPSTIEKIKVGHAKLAKTTLEKLAAFRFTESSTKMPVQHDHSQNSVIQKETLDSFIRDNDEQLGDDCLASVPHDVNHEIQTTFDNKSHEQTAAVPFPHTAFDEPGEVFSDLFDDLGLDYANSRDTTLLERSDHLCVEMQKESAMQGFSKDRHGNVAIFKSLIPSDEAQSEQDVTDHHPQSSHHWEEGLADEDLLQLDVENIALIHNVEVRENTTNTTPSPGSSEEYDDEYDQGLADEDFIEIRDTEQDDSNNILGNHTTASFGTMNQNTRVENALPAFSSSRSIEDFDDEFDDGGVADEDFMEIMDTEQDGSNNNVLRNQTTVPLGTTGQNTGIKDPLPISSRHLEDFDDEYSMDEKDEAALANLLESDPIVVESHSPPSSILPSETDSRDREIYDEKLGHSPISPISDRLIQPSSAWGENIVNNTQMGQKSSIESLTEAEDWSFLKCHQPPQTVQNSNHECPPTAPLSLSQPSHLRSIADDAHEYLPLAPFARPPFPARVRDRSPVTGITSSCVLRTCFRIGEALRAGSLCSRTNQDAVIELFCRVTFSSREDGCHRQHFQFGDLFHADPPFVNGVVENYMAGGALGEAESRALVTVGMERREGDMGEMVRVLGRLKRVVKGAGWVLEVVNVRKTDWEEVRWTKRIAGAGEVKQEVKYDFETLTRRGMVRD